MSSSTTIARVKHYNITKKAKDLNQNNSPFISVKLITNIINTRVLDLLKVISAKYPDKFPKKAIKDEHTKIIQQIKTKGKPIGNIERKSGKIENNKIIKNTKTGLNVVIAKENRCEARIWDSIYDRVTSKEVTSICAIFNVSDYNDIDIKKFAAKYMIGRQCARKKNASMSYCYQHCKHNPHGNYLATPSKEICYHYLIDGNYI